MLLNNFQDYAPALWNIPEEDTLADLPELIEGDLIEFDDYYNDYIGCGVIKSFTRAEFQNPDTGEFVMLECAIVVSANPDTQWLDFVPLTHIDPLTLSDYISIYEGEYGELSEVSRLRLRLQVVAIMQTHSRLYGGSNLYQLPQSHTALSLEAIA